MTAATCTIVFRAGDYRAVELGADDVPRLQAFLDGNPGYHLSMEGRVPRILPACRAIASTRRNVRSPPVEPP